MVQLPPLLPPIKWERFLVFMIKRIAIYCLWIFSFLLFLTHPVWAVTTSSQITQYTSDTLNIITLIASGAAVFFLIKGGFQYMTSTGKPEAIDQAKKTIKNALIGLVIVLAAAFIVSVFNGALTGAGSKSGSASVSITPIESVKPNDGLTQVLIDAISSVMQNVVESATSPIVNGIIGYLTTTPSVLQNPTIVNFWLVIVGITDSLFVVIVALLGLHVMSSSTFGYDEVELSQLLPKIGIAFLGANVSLFLADYVILTSNAFVTTVLNSTGGLNHAWVVNAITVQNLLSNNTPLITLVFLILFLIIAIILLLMYIGRLIMISLFAVLSPLVFLLWIVPKFSDFAEIAVKSYFVTVFVVFVHVVVIQLASSFLNLPGQTENSLVSIAVAIGLFITLLKIPQLMMQMMFYNTASKAVRKIGHEFINAVTTDKSSSGSGFAAQTDTVKTPRKVVAA